MVHRLVAVFFVVFAVAAPCSAAGQKTAFSERVTRICAGALLFGGKHAIGTRAGAISVSRDIRLTGARRLRLVDAVPKPSISATLARRWIAVERRLVEAYASTYLRVWQVIERGRGARILRQVLGEPDALEHQARTLEALLRVPDCTGGAGAPTPGALT